MINVFRNRTNLCALTTSIFLFLQGMDVCMGSSSDGSPSRSSAGTPSLSGTPSPVLQSNGPNLPVRMIQQNNLYACSPKSFNMNQDPIFCHDGRKHSAKVGAIRAKTYRDTGVYAMGVLQMEQVGPGIGGSGGDVSVQSLAPVLASTTTVTLDRVSILGVKYNDRPAVLGPNAVVNEAMGIGSGVFSAVDAKVNLKHLSVRGFSTGLEAKLGGKINMRSGVISQTPVGVLAGSESYIRLDSVDIDVGAIGLVSYERSPIIMQSGTLFLKGSGVGVVSADIGFAQLNGVNVVSPKDLVRIQGVQEQDEEEISFAGEPTRFVFVSNGGYISFNNRGHVDVSDATGLWIQKGPKNSFLENAMYDINEFDLEDEEAESVGFGGGYDLGEHDEILADGSEDDDEAVDLAILNDVSSAAIDITDHMERFLGTKGFSGLLNISASVRSSTINVWGEKSYGIHFSDRSQNLRNPNQNLRIRQGAESPDSVETYAVLLKNASLRAPDGIAIYGDNFGGYVVIEEESNVSGNLLLKAEGSSNLSVLVDDSLIMGGARIDGDARADLFLTGGSEWYLTEAVYKGWDNSGSNCVDSCISSMRLVNSSIKFLSLGGAHSKYRMLRIGNGDGMVYRADGHSAVFFNVGLVSDGSGKANKMPANGLMSDRLLIHGDVSGMTKVYVSPVGFENNADADAAQQKNYSVSLIQVFGKANSNSFTLEGDYVTLKGPYKYVLRAYGPSVPPKMKYFERGLLARATDVWDFRLESENIPFDYLASQPFGLSGSNDQSVSSPGRDNSQARGASQVNGASQVSGAPQTGDSSQGNGPLVLDPSSDTAPSVPVSGGLGVGRVLLSVPEDSSSEEDETSPSGNGDVLVRQESVTTDGMPEALPSGGGSNEVEHTDEGDNSTVGGNLDTTGIAASGTTTNDIAASGNTASDTATSTSTVVTDTSRTSVVNTVSASTATSLPASKGNRGEAVGRSLPSSLARSDTSETMISATLSPGSALVYTVGAPAPIMSASSFTRSATPAQSVVTDKSTISSTTSSSSARADGSSKENVSTKCDDTGKNGVNKSQTPYSCSDGRSHTIANLTLKANDQTQHSVHAKSTNTVIKLENAAISGADSSNNESNVDRTKLQAVSAVLAEDGAEVVLDKKSTIKSSLIGLEAQRAGKVKMNNGTVSVHYVGALAGSGSSVNLSNTAITVTGDLAVAGLASNAGEITMDSGTISLAGGVAVRSESGGRVKLRKVDITANNGQEQSGTTEKFGRAAFLLSDNSSIDFVEGNVVTDANALWVRGTDGIIETDSSRKRRSADVRLPMSRANIESSIVKVEGDKSYGIYFDGTGRKGIEQQSQNKHLEKIVSESSVESASKGDTVEKVTVVKRSVVLPQEKTPAVGITGDVSLKQTDFDVSKSIAIYGNNSGGRVFLENKTTLAGDLLLVAENDSNILLSANNSIIAGGARIDDTSRAHIDLSNQSVWIVAKGNYKRQQLSNLSCLDSCISSIKLADSVIEFSIPESGKYRYQTLRIGEGHGIVYSAHGDAVININARLNPNDTSGDQVTDRLLIHGDVSGKTVVHVDGISDNDKGDVKKAHSVSIIQVYGKAEKDSFQLNGNYVALGNSPYKYTLRSYNPEATLSDEHVSQKFDKNGGKFWNFRLENQYVQSNGSAYTSVAGVKSVASSGQVVRSVVPQVPTYLLLPNTLFHAGLMDISNQHKQLESMRATPKGMVEIREKPAVFLRGYGGSYRYASNLSALEYGYGGDLDYNAVEAGVSLQTIESVSSAISFGIMGSYGKLSLQPLEVEQSQKSDFNKWTATAYGSMQHEAGFYVDGLLSYGLFKGDVLTLARGTTATLEGRPLSASLTGGQAFVTGYEGIVFDPQIQVSYQILQFSQARDIDNFDIEMGNLDQWLVRVGGRLTKAPKGAEGMNAVSFYGKLHLVHGFGSKQMVRFTDDFQLGAFGSSLEAGLGINARLSQKFVLHSDVIYQHKLTKAGFSGASFSGGMRYQF
ncbi:autotransporter outer membrane beta-barrel domain-containing protein [Bartonella doshiae]|uniref:Type V secretory pathway, adhesin AidA n=2 Tax=Bartonella doshiae TaxID=33044 RepID=A0A380ZFI7_BARDO|nr:autotransporter outer membrane beta-barrel domain-containing protein [Bartonella doshiae]EJF80577.1 outer membrane autotransporter barrel domain-containing protein [Bartonella doshiae NCTC 12862 = ATCC 700133]MBB6159845.1 outer membrane autotransporter protein [Bartonella doshiae]SUV45361.1 Type V secretory pathway, adhesin AidA [Bartonella doshiae]